MTYREKQGEVVDSYKQLRLWELVKTMNLRKYHLACLLIVGLALFTVPAVKAQHATTTAIATVSYEKIYVPAYSRVLTHEGIGQSLASTLVIHNTDTEHAITVSRVDYFDNSGNLQREMVEDPLVLAPFQSESFLIPLNDQSGDFGANFLVEWRSDTPTTSPVVEAVMIGGSGTHGISFVSGGRVIERRP